MASRAGRSDPVVVPIEDDEPTMTFDEWLARLEERDPVDLGVSAAELLAGTR